MITKYRATRPQQDIALTSVTVYYTKNYFNLYKLPYQIKALKRSDKHQALSLSFLEMSSWRRLRSGRSPETDKKFISSSRKLISQMPTKSDLITTRPHPNELWRRAALTA